MKGNILKTMFGMTIISFVLMTILLLFSNESPFSNKSKAMDKNKKHEYNFYSKSNALEEVSSKLDSLLESIK